MTMGFEKMMESQQAMLDQWLELTRNMFTPFREATSPHAGAEQKKSTKPEKAGKTEWMEGVSGFWEQWFSNMEKATRQSWEVYQKMTGMTEKDRTSFDVAKMWRDGARFWTDWMQDSRTRWRPEYLGDWYKQWFKVWEAPLKLMNGNGKNPFSSKGFHRSLFSLMETYPADQWCNLLSSYNEFLENYIEFVDGIDLPFDEMAASWEKMLDVYRPQENMPSSILGESMTKYAELMSSPFHGVVEPPHVMAVLKLGYAIQFYTLTLLIRNAEMRAMVLESSLAAWPEAIQACNKEFEQNGNTPTVFHFHQEFLDRLEEHLHKLMQSKNYIQLQEKIVEAMVTLKANLNKWFEVSTASLPLVTQSDMNDIAQELEALRVKIRKLSSEEPLPPAKKVKTGPTTSMN